jgi:hypothetical protein
MPIKTKGVKDPFSITLKEMAWRSDAACAGEDNAKFFATPLSKSIDDAISICRQCPVRINCLHESIIYSYHGVWGGSTHDQRIVLVRKFLNSDVTDLSLSQVESFLPIVDSIGKNKTTALLDVSSFIEKDNNV